MADQKFRWLVLVVAWLASIVALTSANTPAPLLPLIINDLHITYADAGWIVAIFSIPGVLAIPFGALSDRFGTVRLGILSLITLTVGSLLVASSPTFDGILAGRLIGGVASGSISVLAPAIISQWFPPSELGAPMGIYGTGLPIAIVASFNLLARLGIAYGWRLPFYTAAVINIAILALFCCFVREGPLMEKGRKDQSHKALKRNLTDRETWKLGFFFLLFLGGWTSFSTWAPTLLSQFNGINLAMAAFLASSPMVISVFAMPPLGYFSDRIGRRKLLLIIGAAVMTAFILAIPVASGLTLYISLVAMGVAFAVVSPIVFSLAGEALGPEAAGISFGIVNTGANIGMVSPVIAGLVLSMTASLELTLVAIGIFTGLSLVFACLLRTR